jgi:AhpD family alkylhydroperoxidase
MDEDVKKFFNKSKTNAGKTLKLTPQGVNVFQQLHSKTMTEGVLPVKQKESIAIAIGLALRCEPCIRAHIRKALSIETTEKEILEATQVALIMGGGPAYTYIPIAIETIEALKT